MTARRFTRSRCMPRGQLTCQCARLLRSPVALSRRPIPAIVSRGSKIVLLFAAIDLLFRAMSGACYLPAACPAQGFSDGQSQSLRGAGYDAFLKKPFQVRQVVEAIEAATNLVH